MRKGDAIQCWSDKECTRKMMELASKGINTEEQPKGSNRLVIISILGEKEDEQ